MQTLWILFSALSVYGIGITVVDMFGVFEHAAHDQDAADGDDAGDGHSGHDEAEGDATIAEVTAADNSSDDAEAGNDSPEDDEAGHDGGLHPDGHDSGHSLLVYEQQLPATSVRLWQPPAERGTRLVAKSVALLRTSVYFALGAGPTGLFSLLTGQGALSTMLWSGGAGLFIAIISRLVRKALRKDLDSSIKPEEYLMDMAIVSVPVMPGQIGKALVRSYDREIELYIRAKNAASLLPKGTSVRIVEFDDEVYFVEPE